MKVRHCYNLAYYKPKLWERILLLFLPLKVNEGDDMIIYYRQFMNRLYVLGTLMIVRGSTWSSEATHPERN